MEIISKHSGYKLEMKYEKTQRFKKQEQKWLNPTYSQNVKTNIGTVFLNLVNKHFLYAKNHTKSSTSIKGSTQIKSSFRNIYGN